MFNEKKHDIFQFLHEDQQLMRRRERNIGSPIEDCFDPNLDHETDPFEIMSEDDIDGKVNYMMRKAFRILFNVDIPFLTLEDENETTATHNNDYNDADAQTSYFDEIPKDDIISDEMIIAALEFLYKSLTIFKRDTRVFESEHIITTLVDLLTLQNPKIISNLINLILLLVQENQNLIDFFLSTPILSILRNISETEPFIRQKSLSFASIVVFCDKNNISTLFEYDFINIALETIENGKINEKLSAISLMANILYVGSKDEIQRVCNVKLFDCFFQFLTEGYENSFQRCILDSLVNCLLIDVWLDKEITLKQFLLSPEYNVTLQNLCNSADELTAELSNTVISLIS